MPEPNGTVTSSWSVRLSAIGIVVAALAAYHNTFSLPFVFDDQLVVLDNPTIRDLRKLGDVLATSRDGSGAAGRPLLNLSFALNHALGGFAVQGYHIGNLLLHTASALVLFGLVRRTLLLPRMRSRFAAAALSIALSVGAIWAVHPLNTESVTCISQRTELLVAFFFLLTLYCIARSVDASKSRRWHAAAVVSCLFGMASKEVMVTMPLIALLFDRAFLAGTFRDAWRQRKGLHLALLSTWVLMGALVVAMGGSRGDAAGFGLGVSAWSYALKQCEAILAYVKLAVWPHPLVLDYGTDVVHTMRQVLPQGLALLTLLGLTTWALVYRPALGFLCAWFFIILGPSSSFVPLVAQTMAEHRMYLPLISVVVLGVIAAHAALGHWWRRVWWVPVVALALTTVQRNEDYRSELELWRDTAAKRPSNPRAHLCLGLTLMKHGRNDEAVAAFLRVLLLDRTHSTAHNSLGQLFAARGWHEDAIEHYEIALLGSKSDHAALHSNICDSMRVLRRLPEAIHHGQEAVRLNPRLAVAQGNLGLSLADAGRGAEAIPHYEEAVRLNPNYALARNNLGVALLNAGRLAEARNHLEAAVRIAPDFAAAHNSLGAVLDHLGQKAAAIAQFETALRLQPDFADAKRNLGLLRGTTQRVAPAK
jgi:protein O-mannosyl-transferase